MANVLTQIASEALSQFNETYDKNWSFGSNYTSEGTELDVFFNKVLFPKIAETNAIIPKNGNRFNWLVKEVDLISQLSEDYVILDSIPIGLNLNKSGMIMFETNFRRMASKLYNVGNIKKSKFTINNNDMRLRFATLGDMVKYALSLYQKSISDINIAEEAETRGMIVDYLLNEANEQRPATSMEEVSEKSFEAILNLQNNSSKFNETNKASGGHQGRFTTVSSIDDLIILTTDKVKQFMLNTNVANTFQIAGLDPTDRIMSFETLGGNWVTTADIIVDQDILSYLKLYGDYETALGDTILKGAMFTMDISEVGAFVGKVEEIKPKTEYFAGILDIRSIRLRRNTQGMLQPPFRNSENGNVNHWLHYYTQKNMVPFYNKITIGA